jgi:hypothetical protein
MTTISAANDLIVDSIKKEDSEHLGSGRFNEMKFQSLNARASSRLRIFLALSIKRRRGHIEVF